MNRPEKGLSAPEFLVVVAAAALAISAGAARLLQLGGGTELPPADSVHVLLQLARVEAASRQVPCRFIYDPEQRSLEVFDTRGTAEPGDDTVLYRTRLNREVAMSRHERWSPLPKELSHHPFEVIFQPNGRVTRGAGKIVIASNLGQETLSIHENGELAVVIDGDT